MKKDNNIYKYSTKYMNKAKNISKIIIFFKKYDL